MHSGFGNAQKANCYIANRAFVAARPIAKGEEITFNYNGGYDLGVAFEAGRRARWSAAMPTSRPPSAIASTPRRMCSGSPNRRMTPERGGRVNHRPCLPYLCVR